MEARSVETVFRRLNEAGVRYLVAGGLAVVAHGHVRFTKDIDLVIALEGENVLGALGAFREMGYRPVVAAVRLEDFALASERRRWVEEKDAKVFTLFSDEHRFTAIDVFVEEPFPFEAAHASALEQEYAPGVPVRFVGRDELIAMKRLAGRPQDLADIAALERLERD